VEPPPASFRVRPLVPPFASLGNPVEVTGQTKRDISTPARRRSSDNVDAMVGIAIELVFPNSPASRRRARVSRSAWSRSAAAILAGLNVRTIHRSTAQCAAHDGRGAPWRGAGRRAGCNHAAASVCIRRPGSAYLRATACR
jgi:hypothetical protein